MSESVSLTRSNTGAGNFKDSSAASPYSATPKARHGSQQIAASSSFSTVDGDTKSDQPQHLAKEPASESEALPLGGVPKSTFVVSAPPPPFSRLISRSDLDLISKRNTSTTGRVLVANASPPEGGPPVVSQVSPKRPHSNHQSKACTRICLPVGDGWCEPRIGHLLASNASQLEYRREKLAKTARTMQEDEVSVEEDLRKCALCHIKGDSYECGRLLPFNSGVSVKAVASVTFTGFWAHTQCALWSSETFLTGLDNLSLEVRNMVDLDVTIQPSVRERALRLLQKLSTNNSPEALPGVSTADDSSLRDKVIGHSGSSEETTRDGDANGSDDERAFDTEFKKEGDDVLLFGSGCAVQAGGVPAVVNKFEAASKRSRKLKCSVCDQAGATMGCCHRGCKQNFHFRCGLRSNILMLPDKRSYCTEHREEGLGLSSRSVCFTGSSKGNSGVAARASAPSTSSVSRATDSATDSGTKQVSNGIEIDLKQKAKSGPLASKRCNGRSQAIFVEGRVAALKRRIQDERRALFLEHRPEHSKVFSLRLMLGAWCAVLRL